ncbi:hypothetical protein TraAM80_02483 [Trypanosoma rangeli]|uniref:Uncharacterized protein n=1 Tax=Trypanosoma rangeli TaxID=5698 RepID=A0A3R7KLJ0_TRYRA|nr:uncharacterized protein TraAM80_02483 [Trypanosoma rangeli]RNF08851.1 hypothetical protein TraAM80_02483 [Trypanosoma rangeli]|eukprot:RNF08851.1 hypothetical protein TraAM80_02483 [Trypanosoma rangeli]
MVVTNNDILENARVMAKNNVSTNKGARRNEGTALRPWKHPTVGADVLVIHDRVHVTVCLQVMRHDRKPSPHVLHHKSKIGHKARHNVCRHAGFVTNKLTPEKLTGTQRECGMHVDPSFCCD